MRETPLAAGGARGVDTHRKRRRRRQAAFTNKMLMVLCLLLSRAAAVYALSLSAHAMPHAPRRSVKSAWGCPPANVACILVNDDLCCEGSTCQGTTQWATCKPTQPAQPPGPSSSIIDIIGYWGNSGWATVVPKLSEVHELYNVLILTFAQVSLLGVFSISRMPRNTCCGAASAYQSREAIMEDVLEWKRLADRWGRERKVLISIGGEGGNFWPPPSSCNTECLVSGAITLLEEYHADGIDLDLEGSLVSTAGSLAEFAMALRERGYTVTAAPEMADGPITGYSALLPALDWVQFQYYNNPLSAVTFPAPGLEANEWPETIKAPDGSGGSIFRTMDKLSVPIHWQTCGISCRRARIYIYI